jgi:hypothetical protein
MFQFCDEFVAKWVFLADFPMKSPIEKMPCRTLYQKYDSTVKNLSGMVMFLERSLFENEKIRCRFPETDLFLVVQTSVYPGF